LNQPACLGRATRRTRKWSNRVTLASATLALPMSIFAGTVQELPENPAPPPTLPENAPPPPVDTFSGGSILSQQEVLLTIAVMIFGVIVIGAELFLLRKLDGTGAEDILRIFGVTLILIGALFLITAGYSAEQISPALGLLGTVAGYLLGKSRTPGEGKSQRS
jgi:hypothetical protein